MSHMTKSGSSPPKPIRITYTPAVDERLAADHTAKNRIEVSACILAPDESRTTSTIAIGTSRFKLTKVALPDAVCISVDLVASPSGG